VSSVVLRASRVSPGLSRAVLHPRCARARPAPSPAWLVMSSGLDDPTRPATSPLRGSPIPCCTPPPAYVMPHAKHASRQALRLIPRATVICNVHGDCTAQRPRLALRLRSSLVPAPQPRRRPRRPRHRPRQQSCHVLCSIPRRSRAFHAAPAPPRTSGAGWVPGHPDPASGFRGVERSSTSSSL